MGGGGGGGGGGAGSNPGVVTSSFFCFLSSYFLPLACFRLFPPRVFCGNVCLV